MLEDGWSSLGNLVPQFVVRFPNSVPCCSYHAVEDLENSHLAVAQRFLLILLTLFWFLISFRGARPLARFPSQKTKSGGISFVADVQRLQAARHMILPYNPRTAYLDFM
jgi:thiosulfate reductase cytochrome b subunit